MKNASTLVDRLRGIYKFTVDSEEGVFERTFDVQAPIQLEAADEIEFLVNALTEIAEYSNTGSNDEYVCSAMAKEALKHANKIRED